MNTVLECWQIVSIVDNEKLVGKVLWGICVNDKTSRFQPGDYVCTSKITEIIPKSKLIKTHTGSSYQVQGDGIEAEIQVEDFDLLRRGFSPEEINQLRLAPSGLLN